MADLLGLGGGISGAHQRSPFGQLPFGIAGGLGGQIRGLEQAFGFGPRGPAQERSLERLLGRGGPLAEFANQVRGFSGNVIPEAQAAGQQVATRGSEAFNTLTQQIAAALGDVSQARGGAQQFFGEAFDPTSQTPFYQEAFRRAVAPERSAAAARGLLESGPGQAGEDELSRRLTTDFAQQQLGMQQAAIPLLTGVGQAGVGTSGIGLEAVPQLANALTSQYGIPLQAAGGLLQLLTSQQTPALQLLGETKPQFTPFTAKGSGKGG